MSAEPTTVFAVDPSGHCAVLFLAHQVGTLPESKRAETWASVKEVLDDLRDSGWVFSARAMAGHSSDSEPVAYRTGFAHDVDLAGVFEAPSAGAALAGTARLEQAGWTQLLQTEWLLGIREFGPVGPADWQRPARWGFVALWEWNDAWCAASPEERRDYDAECDIAFAADLTAGISITGRHRMDWASRWHHLAVWETDSLEVIKAAMADHERVADFKMALSRHYIGQRASLGSILGLNHD